MRCRRPPRPRRASSSARGGEPCQLWAVLWSTVPVSRLQLRASAPPPLHRRLSAASGAQRESGSGPSRPDSRTSRSSRPGTPESWTQRQQPPLRPAKPAHPPSPRPPRPPSPAPAPRLLRNQPSAFQPQPQPQPQPKRPSRPPSPVVRHYGKG